MSIKFIWIYFIYHAWILTAKSTKDFTKNTIVVSFVDNLSVRCGKKNNDYNKQQNQNDLILTQLIYLKFNIRYLSYILEF